MIFRGIKSRVFLQLWLLFFLALLIIDVLILFFVLEKSLSGTAGGQTSYAIAFGEYRDIQQLAFVFVVINSFFFALFANQHLNRIYFRPLRRLTKRAETYQAADPFLISFRKEDREFSVLSTALNEMLDRIADDQRLLNETIESLQAANVELTQAQNDVIRAEKLATVGRLTAGIAHEVGNPLGIVLGYLDLIGQPDVTASQRNDFVARSQQEIGRINHIIRQLLDMSRSSDETPQRVHVHDLLRDLISVFAYQSAADGLDFQPNLTAAHDGVFGDPDRLRQVFLNILLNAIDAVNGNPAVPARIDIATTCVFGLPGRPATAARPFIQVTIKDSGHGIAASLLPTIFDPFLTTKEPGQGTGLGLSVAFMIVEKYGGFIHAFSRQDRSGAVFQVALPLWKPAAETPSDPATGDNGR
jgi:signal transduction histidine kinase